MLKAAAAFKPMNNQTVRDRLKFYIDRLIYSANSFDELLSLLEKQGYAIKRNKYTAVKPPYAQRFLRLRSLGGDYTEAALKKRIKERNEIPNEFKRMQERYASELQQPFYYAINTNISLVRNFRITPTKQDTQYPYSFTNDCTIERLTSCLGTLSEFNINSRSELYKASERLQEQIENCADENESVDLKIQYAKIYSTIRTYEEIVDGNYIDNLLKAERERTEAEQKKENAPEQPIKPTINRKMHRR